MIGDDEGSVVSVPASQAGSATGSKKSSQEEIDPSEGIRYDDEGNLIRPKKKKKRTGWMKNPITVLRHRRLAKLEREWQESNRRREQRAEDFERYKMEQEEQMMWETLELAPRNQKRMITEWEVDQQLRAEDEFDKRRQEEIAHEEGLSFDSSVITKFRKWQHSPANFATLEGHRAAVHACRLTADERFILSASEDCELRVWETASGKCVMIYEGHVGTVRDCDVHPDFRLNSPDITVVSCSVDSTCRLWNSANTRAIRILRGHTAAVYACRLAPNGHRFVSCSEDGTVRTWKFPEGFLLFTYRAHHSAVTHVDFSPSGRYLASCADFGDRRIMLWDSFMPVIQKPVSLGTKLIWTPEGLIKRILFKPYPTRRFLTALSELVLKGQPESTWEGEATDESDRNQEEEDSTSSSDSFDESSDEAQGEDAVQTEAMILRRKMREKKRRRRARKRERRRKKMEEEERRQREKDGLVDDGSGDDGAARIAAVYKDDVREHDGVAIGVSMVNADGKKVPMEEYIPGATFQIELESVRPFDEFFIAVTTKDGQYDMSREGAGMRMGRFRRQVPEGCKISTQRSLACSDPAYFQKRLEQDSRKGAEDIANETAWARLPEDKRDKLRAKVAEERKEEDDDNDSENDEPVLVYHKVEENSLDPKKGARYEIVRFGWDCPDPAGVLVVRALVTFTHEDMAADESFSHSSATSRVSGGRRAGGSGARGSGPPVVRETTRLVHSLRASRIRIKKDKKELKKENAKKAKIAARRRKRAARQSGENTYGQEDDELGLDAEGPDDDTVAGGGEDSDDEDGPKYDFDMLEQHDSFVEALRSWDMNVLKHMLDPQVRLQIGPHKYRRPRSVFNFFRTRIGFNFVAKVSTIFKRGQSRCILVVDTHGGMLEEFLRGFEPAEEITDMSALNQLLEQKLGNIEANESAGAASRDGELDASNQQAASHPPAQLSSLSRGTEEQKEGEQQADGVLAGDNEPAAGDAAAAPPPPAPKDSSNASVASPRGGDHKEAMGGGEGRGTELDDDTRATREGDAVAQADSNKNEPNGANEPPGSPRNKDTTAAYPRLTKDEAAAPENESEQQREDKAEATVDGEAIGSVDDEAAAVGGGPAPQTPDEQKAPPPPSTDKTKSGTSPAPGPPEGTDSESTISSSSPSEDSVESVDSDLDPIARASMETYNVVHPDKYGADIPHMQMQMPPNYPVGAGDCEPAVALQLKRERLLNKGLSLDRGMMHAMQALSKAGKKSREEAEKKREKQRIKAEKKKERARRRKLRRQRRKKRARRLAQKRGEQVGLLASLWQPREKEVIALRNDIVTYLEQRGRRGGMPTLKGFDEMYTKASSDQPSPTGDTNPVRDMRQDGGDGNTQTKEAAAGPALLPGIVAPTSILSAPNDSELANTGPSDRTDCRRRVPGGLSETGEARDDASSVQSPQTARTDHSKGTTGTQRSSNTSQRSLGAVSTPQTSGTSRRQSNAALQDIRESADAAGWGNDAHTGIHNDDNRPAEGKPLANGVNGEAAAAEDAAVVGNGVAETKPGDVGENPLLVLPSPDADEPAAEVLKVLAQGCDPYTQPLTFNEALRAKGSAGRALKHAQRAAAREAIKKRKVEEAAKRQAENDHVRELRKAGRDANEPGEEVLRRRLTFPVLPGFDKLDNSDALMNQDLLAGSHHHPGHHHHKHGHDHSAEKEGVAAGKNNNRGGKKRRVKHHGALPDELEGKGLVRVFRVTDKDEAAHNHTINYVLFSHSERRILSCGQDATIRMWDPREGRLVKQFVGHDRAVLSAQFAQNDIHFLSCGADQSIILWETATGVIVRRLRGHVDTVYRCVASAAFDMLVSCSHDNTLKIWMMTPRPPAKPEPPRIRHATYESVTFVWTAPPAFNEPLSAFEVEYRTGIRGEWVNRDSIPPHWRKKTVRGLQPAAPYQFRVRAINRMGTGEWSSPSKQAVTLFGPPDKMDRPAVGVRRAHSMLLYWFAESPNVYGTAIKQFRIQMEGDGYLFRNDEDLDLVPTDTDTNQQHRPSMPGSARGSTGDVSLLPTKAFAPTNDQVREHYILYADGRLYGRKFYDAFLTPLIRAQTQYVSRVQLEAQARMEAMRAAAAHNHTHTTTAASTRSQQGQQPDTSSSPSRNRRQTQSPGPSATGPGFGLLAGAAAAAEADSDAAAFAAASANKKKKGKSPKPGLTGDAASAEAEAAAERQFTDFDAEPALGEVDEVNKLITVDSLRPPPPKKLPVDFDVRFPARLTFKQIGHAQRVHMGRELQLMAFVVENLKPGASYRFRISALNESGTSGFSEPTYSESTLATLPNIPSRPRILSATLTSLTLTWVAPASNGSSIQGYRVRLCSTPVKHHCDLDRHHTTYEWPGLEAGQRYRFQVLAKNAQGWSPYSAPSHWGRTAIAAPEVCDRPRCEEILTTKIKVCIFLPENNGAEITSIDVQFREISAFRQSVWMDVGRTSLTGEAGSARVQMTQLYTEEWEEVETGEGLPTTGEGLPTTGEGLPAAGSSNSSNNADPRSSGSYRPKFDDSAFTATSGSGSKTSIDDAKPIAEAASTMLNDDSPTGGGGDVGADDAKPPADPLAQRVESIAGPAEPLTPNPDKKNRLSFGRAGRTPDRPSEPGSDPGSDGAASGVVLDTVSEHAADAARAKKRLIDVSAAEGDAEMAKAGKEVTQADEQAPAVFVWVNKLLCDSTYEIRARASNRCGDAEWSLPSHRVTTLGPQLPLAPSKLPWTEDIMSSSMLVLWGPAESPGIPLRGYEIEQASVPSKRELKAGVEVETTTYSVLEDTCRNRVIKLQPGTRYKFRVRGENALGSGPWTRWSKPAKTPDPTMLR